MLLRPWLGYVLRLRLSVPRTYRWVPVLGKLLMKKPTEHTVTRGISILGIVAALTAFGSLIAVWQKIVPYVTDVELLRVERLIHENQRLDDEEKEARCDNTIARINNWIHLANMNKWEADNRTPPDRAYAATQERAITGYQQDMLKEKRDCGF